VLGWYQRVQGWVMRWVLGWVPALVLDLATVWMMGWKTEGKGWGMVLVLGSGTGWVMEMFHLHMQACQWVVA
jgi:hypothetical protein